MASIAAPALNPLAVHPRFRAIVLVGGGLLFALCLWAFARAALGLAPPVRLTPQIVAHLALVVPALPLGAYIFVSRETTRWHRQLGWLWISMMTLSALVTFAIRDVNDGRLSFIHIFAAWTMFSAPRAIIRARQGRYRAHAANLKGLFAGSLLIAGFTAFIPGRVMWAWAFE